MQFTVFDKHGAVLDGQINSIGDLPRKLTNDYLSFLPVREYQLKYSILIGEQNMAKYKKKSFEDKKKEVTALTNKMEKQIENHFRSPEELKEYLSFMAKFYNYSPSNIALINSHFEGAMAVGSFKFWQDRGYSVNKGEKGIPVLVPTRSKQYEFEKDKWRSLKYATTAEKEKIKSGKIRTKEGKLYFTQGHVFDVSQTNAKTKELPKIFPNKWLEGNVSNYNSLYKGMESIAKNNGIEIVQPLHELGAAKGVSYTDLKKVALNPRNSELQNVKTLIHELAHAKLHTTESFKNYTTSEKEFQAEMTAYTVSSHFGIDTTDYSLDYLYGWTKDKEFKDKTKLLKEVHETSIEFIETIERSLFAEKEKSQDMEKDTNKKEDNNKTIKHKNKSIQLER